MTESVDSFPEIVDTNTIFVDSHLVCSRDNHQSSVISNIFLSIFPLLSLRKAVSSLSHLRNALTTPAKESRHTYEKTALASEQITRKKPKRVFFNKRIALYSKSHIEINGKDACRYGINFLTLGQKKVLKQNIYAR